VIVFGIVKLLFALATLVAFVWFGANVSLGSRTLFEHLQAIGQTHETRDLLEGTRESARPFTKPILDGVRRRLASAGHALGEAAADGGAPPSDEVPVGDRLRLRRLLDDRHAAR
jgi:hypothetical protein